MRKRTEEPRANTGPLERSVTVHARDRIDLEIQLELVTERLRQGAALEDRCGILVTRHSAFDFTVEAHPDVPYGMTREKSSWPNPVW